MLLVSLSILSWPLFPRALLPNQQLPPCLQQQEISICSLSKQQNQKSRQRNSSPRTPSCHCMAQEPCNSRVHQVNHLAHVYDAILFYALPSNTIVSYKTEVGHTAIVFKWTVFLLLQTWEDYWNVNTKAIEQNSVWLFNQVCMWLTDLWIQLLLPNSLLRVWASAAGHWGECRAVRFDFCGVCRKTDS